MHPFGAIQIYKYHTPQRLPMIEDQLQQPHMATYFGPPILCLGHLLWAHTLLSIARMRYRGMPRSWSFLLLHSIGLLLVADQTTATPDVWLGLAWGSWTAPQPEPSSVGRRMDGGKKGLQDRLKGRPLNFRSMEGRIPRTSVSVLECLGGGLGFGPRLDCRK